MEHYEGKGYAPYSLPSLEEAFLHPSVDYIVLCVGSNTFPLTQDMYPDFVAAALKSRAFGITSIGRGTLVLRRGADHQEGLRLLSKRAEVVIRSPDDIDRAIQVISSDVSAAR